MCPLLSMRRLAFRARRRGGTPGRLWARAGLGLFAAAATGGMGARDATTSGTLLGAAAARYRSEVIGYFKAHALLPVLVPAGQQIGDVYDPEYWVLEERAGRCFPSLTRPAAEPSALPAFSLSTAADVGFALGLGRLLNLSASVDAGQKATVTFSDVRVATASKGELRRALSEECAHLRPIVDETAVPPAQIAVKAVIGAIVYAKPLVFLDAETAAAAQAQTASLRNLIAAAFPAAALAVRGLDANASAGLGFGQRHGVLVETQSAIPVAFAPAFLPKPIFDQTRGGSDAVVLQGYRWQAFDAGSPEQKRLFERIVDASAK